MTRQELLDRLAPCGLDCMRCLARSGGEVERASLAVLGALGGFDKHAERFAAFDPVFADYPAFKRVADRLAAGRCLGCRRSGCLHSACKVHLCVRETGVDFCYQCAEFPCDSTGLEGPLLDRWRKNNERMREIGLEAYVAETLERHRY